MNWYLVGLRKYATFSGRARRAEFWMFTLVDAAIVAILFGGALAVALNSRGGYYPLRLTLGIGSLIYVLAVLLPSLAVRIRRLHDTGRSGWYFCWSFLPIAGPIVVLVALCGEGTRGPNAYGPDPKSPPWPGHPVDPAAAYPFGQPAVLPQPYGSHAGGPPFGPPVVAPAAPLSPVPPAAKRSRAGIAAAVTMGMLLLLVCGGVVRGFAARPSETKTASGPSTPARSTPARSVPLTGLDPSAGAATAENGEPGSQEPQASTYPAEQIGDLDRVCNDNIFYPQSPKRSGKAPHPVVLLVEDGDGSDIRLRNGHYHYADEGLTDRDKAIWASDDPRTVQMVACLDRVSTGKQLRNCQYDDPAPETVALMRADWRLRVYEVATGAKIHDKAMPGDDQKCPTSVRVGPDRKIYAEVSSRSIIVALRGYVKK